MPRSMPASNDRVIVRADDHLEPPPLSRSAVLPVQVGTVTTTSASECPCGAAGPVASDRTAGPPVSREDARQFQVTTARARANQRHARGHPARGGDVRISWSSLETGARSSGDYVVRPQPGAVAGDPWSRFPARAPPCSPSLSDRCKSGSTSRAPPITACQRPPRAAAQESPPRVDRTAKPMLSARADRALMPITSRAVDERAPVFPS